MASSSLSAPGPLIRLASCSFATTRTAVSTRVLARAARRAPPSPPRVKMTSLLLHSSGTGRSSPPVPRTPTTTVTSSRSPATWGDSGGTRNAFRLPGHSFAFGRQRFTRRQEAVGRAGPSRLLRVRDVRCPIQRPLLAPTHTDNAMIPAEPRRDQRHQAAPARNTNAAWTNRGSVRVLVWLFTAGIVGALFWIIYLTVALLA